MDTEKNGYLTVDNVNEALDEFLKLKQTINGESQMVTCTNHTEEEYKQIMESMDLNHDGKVTWEEFVAAAIDKVALLNDQNIDAVFNLLDKDKCEKITMEDIKGQLGDGKKLDQNEMIMWQQMLDDADKDKCGSITRVEFRQAMREVMEIKLEKLHDHEEQKIPS